MNTQCSQQQQQQKKKKRKKREQIEQKKKIYIYIYKASLRFQCPSLMVGLYLHVFLTITSVSKILLTGHVLVSTRTSLWVRSLRTSIRLVLAQT